ncbi:MAG: efflux RND transporter periplasmic adaptor subunit [Oscillospiraceae bacterium]|nr:efflux RND transporter periplasmic adaptor subunit [Oscillospiraceae bacterium]
MVKKRFVITAALALALSLNACGAQGDGISVQRADQLTAAARAEERYVGIVDSQDVLKIQRDSTKTIEELYVSVGQKVEAGDKLFTYDSAALELDLEKAQLEVEKMQNEQTTYAGQLETLEKQLKRTYDESTKVRLTLEINTLKTTQMENDYNLAAREEEITKLQEMLDNIDITAPAAGTVRQIDETGESGAYITIQQSGAYRIKGMVNEMSIGSGIMEGTRVKIFSRLSSQVWMGTVAYIDLEDASQNNTDYWNSYGMTDTMTTSSSYPFYVDLDDTEGLLLGQHVYMEVAAVETGLEGLWVPENYLTDMAFDEETGETTAKVWADNGRGKLEQRDVSLGMYDGMTGSYEILSGLTAEDYVADPAVPGCEAGASTVRREPEDFGGAVLATTGEEMSSDEVIIPEEEIITEETALADPLPGEATAPAGETTGE